MAFTRDYDEHIVDRMRNDPEFARSSFEKVIELIVGGEPETARMILRNLVNATLGFEELARRTERHPKSLHQMISARGNPTMDNLSGILREVASLVAHEPRKKSGKRRAV